MVLHAYGFCPLNFQLTLSTVSTLDIYRLKNACVPIANFPSGNNYSSRNCFPWRNVICPFHFPQICMCNPSVLFADYLFLNLIVQGCGSCACSVFVFVCTQIQFEFVNLAHVSNCVYRKFKSYYTFLCWGWSLYTYASVLWVVHVNIKNACRKCFYVFG
jgi:hypothetical protein